MLLEYPRTKKYVRDAVIAYLNLDLTDEATAAVIVVKMLYFILTLPLPLLS